MIACHPRDITERTEEKILAGPGRASQCPESDRPRIFQPLRASRHHLYAGADSHAEYALQVAAAGKPAHVEKPMARDLIADRALGRVTGMRYQYSAAYSAVSSLAPNSG